ncbi:MAG: serine/threonine-protein phosphatase [Wenzhouxiangella sp.]|nr:MAG: serine/threonine-protein phosphatase [Wenzhouxiangella sp.]
MTPDPVINHRSVGQSETGRVRASNQDAILVDEAARLWLVADGMGGHAGGAEASSLARATIQASVAAGASMRSAILAAHYAIRAEQSANPELSDMGTTVVALRELVDGYEIEWVGDSRAYLFDRASRRLRQLTRDHNLAGLMMESGALSQAEAASHPKRHVLTDCLGRQGETEPRIDRISGQWQSGQLLLLCSDGLSGELGDDQIGRILSAHRGLDEMADRLMSGAMAAGARDNISLILIRSPMDSAASGKESPWRRWLGGIGSKT